MITPNRAVGAGPAPISPWGGDKNSRMWTSNVDTGGGVARTMVTPHWVCHSKQFKTIDPFNKQQESSYSHHTAR